MKIPNVGTIQSKVRIRDDGVDNGGMDTGIYTDDCKVDSGGYCQWVTCGIDLSPLRDTLRVSRWLLPVGHVCY